MIEKGVDFPCKSSIYRILDEIKDPCSVANSVPMGLVEMGLVDDIDIAADGSVAIHLRLTSPFCEMIAFFQNEVTDKVAALAAVSQVKVTHDAGLDWDPDMMAESAKIRRRERMEQLKSLPVTWVSTG
jgi:metal-sulfur cluster biosynthetic enzyme